MTASEATLGRSLPATVTVEQPLRLVGVNRLAGVVTDVHDTSAVDQGDPLYAIDGQRVTALRGDLPFYRDLARGVVGDDVRQLQAALADLGHLPSSEVDGRFDNQTRRAVDEWQRASGVPRTGTVLLGTVVAVPQLPTQVELGEAVVKSRILSGGEDAVFSRSGERRFTIAAQPEQARQLPQGTQVRIQLPGRELTAVAAETRQDENGTTTIQLSGVDGGDVCDDVCTGLPPEPLANLSAEVVLVPETTGIAVPAAAVRTRADGATVVHVAGGTGGRGTPTELPVEVLVADGGLVIVEGVDSGSKVLLPAATDR